jgi:hypothetical protein
MNYTPIELYLNSSNSSFRVNGSDYNSDMIFYFNQPITKPADYNFTIKVQSFVLPLSYYLINSTNNKIVFFRTGNLTEYTLPIGNYNIKTLITALTTLCGGDGYSFSYDTSTLLFTITHTTDSFHLDYRSTIQKLIGFYAGVDFTSTGVSLTSPYVINLSGENNMLYIDLTNIQTSNLSSRDGNRTSILKSIANTNREGDLLVWINQTDAVSYLQDEVLTFFHIRILGEDIYTPVNLNGQDWNMTLVVSVIPKEKQSKLTSLDFKGAYEEYLSKITLTATPPLKS